MSVCWGRRGKVSSWFHLTCWGKIGPGKKGGVGGGESKTNVLDGAGEGGFWASLFGAEEAVHGSGWIRGASAGEGVSSENEDVLKLLFPARCLMVFQALFIEPWS